MASLRARLLVGLLGLTAIALLLLAGITYVEQRAFLMDRVDEQARAARGPIDGALEGEGFGGGPGGRGPEDGPRGPGGGGDPSFGLPPGTYGERRDGTGAMVGDPVVISYGEEISADPALPAAMPLERPITVEDRGDSDTSYRAYAVPRRGGRARSSSPSR